jgi:two-component system LytT family sensor kinase
MIQSSSRYKFIKIFWVVTTVYLCLLMLGVIASMMMANENHNWKELLKAKGLIKMGASLVCTTTFYYFTLNYYNKLIVERKKFNAYLPFTVIAIIAVFSYHLGMDYFFPTSEKVKAQFSTSVMIFSYCVSTIFIITFSLLLAYLNNLRDEKKQRKILEAQKMQLEVEKSAANFNFLKAQINPHFLHNTLNFLYAKSLPYSQELSEGILTLSDIMRYALSEGNAKDGKALLQDEIEHVRNVIKINQLRFSNNLNITFEVHGVVNGTMIIPFVLITLVENAFKHGDLKSSNNPIEIKLDIDEDSLFFFCRNKKKTGPKELSTGIGLDNIRKRLDLAYGKDYKLVIKDEADLYTTELTLHRL